MFLSSTESSIFSETGSDSFSENEYTFNPEENIKNVKKFNKIIIKLFLKNRKYYEQIKYIALTYLSKIEDIEFDSAQKSNKGTNEHIYSFYFDTYDAIEYGENELIYYMQNNFHKFIDVINNYSIPFFFRLIFINCYFEFFHNEELKKKKHKYEFGKKYNSMYNNDSSKETDSINKTCNNFVSSNDCEKKERKKDGYEDKNINKDEYEYEDEDENGNKDDSKDEYKDKEKKDDISFFYDFIDYDFNKDKKIMEEIDIYSAFLMKGLLYSYKNSSFLKDLNIKLKISNCLKMIFDKHNIKIKCRVINIPYIHDIHINYLQEIENKHIGKFITVEGIITRVGEKKILEECKKYRCMKCDNIIQKKAIPELYYNTQTIFMCPNYYINTNIPYEQSEVNRKKKKNNKQKKKSYIIDIKNSKYPFKSKCNGTNFELIESEIRRVDYQEIKIREASKTNIPHSITVVLLENLVGRYSPGKKVIINGIVLRRWKKLYKDIRCDSELFIEANNIEVKKLENIKYKEISLDDDFAKSINIMNKARINEEIENISIKEKCFENSIEKNNFINSMNENKNNSLFLHEKNSNIKDYFTGTIKEKNMYNSYLNIPMNNVEKLFESYWILFKNNKIEGKKYICESICPNLYNCKLSKLSLLLVLIGGNKTNEYDSFYNENNKWKKYFNKNYEDKNNYLENDKIFLYENLYKSKTEKEKEKEKEKKKKKKKKKKHRKRQEKISSENYDKRTLCHLLLVGDPGTGKSQLLKEVQKLSNICMNVSGMFCTTAGLTCAAIKEGNNFMLESGALVLADNGVCCIDEFCLMKNENKNAIHEAMEQLTISVAKGGIVDKLNCRCTIIGASNFELNKNVKGNVASCENKVLIINLSYALLSRFDLVVITEDNNYIDSKVADYVLSQDLEANTANHINKHKEKKKDTENNIPDENKNSLSKLYYSINNSEQHDIYYSSFSSQHNNRKITWPSEKIKEYIYYVKNSCFPNFDKDAKLILITYYSNLRKYNNGDNGTTIRTLESLIRLSEAHSKLILNNLVLPDDVINIILLVELSLRGFQIAIKTNSNNILIARTGILENLNELLETYNKNNNKFYSLDDVLFIDSLYTYFKEIILEKLNLKEINGSIHKME
ncbi:DNA helicase MCM9, putative [Plasmodium relictum]|uniref:DNA helicase MCM9, putative n=1 Tax=Plasmodium relictum TaxID=85471 RepID=A0A1J1H2H1_PLARL|nr:DNA helicase MCM9, putative [Plasmodium relictum]CRG98958.1 DNA helicase MCM9, putative [Plasmodium relictum]